MTSIQRPNSRPVASTLLAVFVLSAALTALAQGFKPTVVFAGANFPFTQQAAPASKPFMADNSMAYLATASNGAQYLHVADLQNKTDVQIVPYAVASATEIAISGTNVAWSNGYMNKWDVYMFEKYTGSTKVVADSQNEIGRPSLDNGQIVWREANYDFGGAQIKYFNNATSELRTITAGKQYTNPVIAGNRIAWFESAGCTNDAYRLCSADGVAKDLVVYNIQNKAVQVIAQNVMTDYAPAISSARVVWTAKLNGHYDLYQFDLSTGVQTRLTNNDLDETYPVLSNGRIGYLGQSLGGTRRIAHAFTIATREDVAMPYKGFNHGWVTIADHNLAWVEVRTDSRIKMYDFDLSASAVDNDHDGLSDGTEQKIGTDTEKKDSDGDGISDTDEIVLFHTNPTTVDSDGDGLTDYEEIFHYHTDPNKFDTDGDGYRDGLEVKTNHNPLSAAQAKINPKKFFVWTAPAK